MYQYLDRPADTLDATDRLLLWSMRQWVARVRAGRWPCAAIGPVLASQGRADMMGDLNMAMALLDHEGLGERRFMALDSAHLSDDESLLLALFACARDDRNDAAAAIIETLIKPEGRHAMAMAVGRIAGATA